jgi:Divergent InlB B-repeat domain
LSRFSLAFVAVLVAAVLVPGAVTGAGGLADGLSVHETTTASKRLPAVRAPASAAATWCGTPSQVDRAPNLLAGYPVHWIYAVPSDGADRLGTFASTMQTDAESIDAWWRREDPARTPRNDLTSFPCGPQLDLTTLRLQLSSNELASEESFELIFEGILEADFSSRYTKYLVYFDGPVANDQVCGRGGSDRSGFGLAVVYVQSCSGVHTAAVAAHELLHTFGAVPAGAPHDCPPPNDSHTCDTTSDLMYPFIDDVPLESKFLDPGRDDYYGHSAAFGDSHDTPWLVHLDSQRPFTVTITGPGRVTADVPGLDCSVTCTTNWNAGTRLLLSATPSPRAKLVRFGGACGGASGCAVTTAPGSAVSALFAPAVVRLSVAVTGRGTVRTSSSGIACRPRCSASLPSYVPVRITATPAKGWKLRSWAGACRGTSRSCTLSMKAATNARAVFVRN